MERIELDVTEFSSKKTGILKYFMKTDVCKIFVELRSFEYWKKLGYSTPENPYGQIGLNKLYISFNLINENEFKLINEKWIQEEKKRQEFAQITTEKDFFVDEKESPFSFKDSIFEIYLEGENSLNDLQSYKSFINNEFIINIINLLKDDSLLTKIFK
jgi:hypothetical protein